MFAQPEPVVNREPSPVVVEVGKHLDLSAPLLDTCLPALQFRLRVVSIAPPAPIVEADEGPIGRQLVGLKSALWVIPDDERGAVLPEERVDVVGEPARMAEFEAMAARRQARERRGQALVVPVEVAGKLTQDGA